jgi:hypothetical protein
VTLELLGRIQCWNDVSLLQWKPEFVVEHPEFNPQSSHGPEDGEGSVGMVEVRDSVVVVGAPMSVAMVFGNAFEFQQSDEGDPWELDIAETTTPAQVFAQMTSYAMATMGG